MSDPEGTELVPLEGTPELVAQMFRDLGRQLAALRHAAGLTQYGLAALVGYSRSAVSLAEIGRDCQAPEFWQACDKALDTGGVLAAAEDRIDEFRSELERAAALAAQQAREARAVAAMALVARPRVTASATAVQPCPHCRAEVTVLATLVPAGGDMNPDLVRRIDAYEKGELGDDEIVRLFQELVDTGLVWELQGHYGRRAVSLIEQGLVRSDPSGRPDTQAP